MFVDDAVDAFLRAGTSEECNGGVYNVGGSEAINLRDLATKLLQVAGTGRVRHVEWPLEKKAIDIGDFYADCSKLTRTVGWRPMTSLDKGLARTVAFYRNHLAHYVSDVS